MDQKETLAIDLVRVFFIQICFNKSLIFYINKDVHFFYKE